MTNRYFQRRDFLRVIGPAALVLCASDMFGATPDDQILSADDPLWHVRLKPDQARELLQLTIKREIFGQPQVMEYLRAHFPLLPNTHTMKGGCEVQIENTVDEFNYANPWDKSSTQCEDIILLSVMQRHQDRMARYFHEQFCRMYQEYIANSERLPEMQVNFSRLKFQGESNPSETYQEGGEKHLTDLRRELTTLEDKLRTTRNMFDELHNILNRTVEDQLGVVITDNGKIIIPNPQDYTKVEPLPFWSIFPKIGVRQSPFHPTRNDLKNIGVDVNNPPVVDASRPTPKASCPAAPVRPSRLKESLAFAKGVLIF